MSSPPRPVQINAEDLGKDSPAWLPLLLGPLNQFARDVVTALTGGLTRAQNMASELKTLTVTTLNPLAGTFPITFQTKVASPSAVWVAQCVPTAPAAIPTDAVAVTSWTTTPSGAIKVGFISGLAASSTYTLTLVVE